MNQSEFPPDISQEALNFRMPKCPPGTPVMWYRSGIRDRSLVEIGYMLHAGERTAVIMSCTGRRVDAVRHADDPKLRLSPEQRENGSWDYTPEYLKVRELEERIAKLEAQLASSQADKQPEAKPKAKPKPGKTRPAPAHLERYRQLRAEAATRGIEVPHNISLEALTNLVQAQPEQASN